MPKQAAITLAVPNWFLTTFLAVTISKSPLFVLIPNPVLFPISGLFKGSSKVIEIGLFLWYNLITSRPLSSAGNEGSIVPFEGLNLAMIISESFKMYLLFIKKYDCEGIFTGCLGLIVIGTSSFWVFLKR